MVLSMAVIASADKEITFTVSDTLNDEGTKTGEASEHVTDAALLNALNTDPSTVTFTVSSHLDDESQMGWDNCAVQVHVVGEDENKVHQRNLMNATANGADQSWTVTGDDVFAKAKDGVYDGGWKDLPVPAGSQIDWVAVSCWNASSGLTAKATVAGAAATGVVVPVAVVTLLGASATGAMIASKKRRA
jgi:hypothetical protein